MTSAEWGFKGCDYRIRVSHDGYFFDNAGLGFKLWNKYRKMTNAQLKSAKKHFVSEGKKAMKYPLCSRGRKGYQTHKGQHICYDYQYDIDVKERCLIIYTGWYEGSVWAKVKFKKSKIDWSKLSEYYEASNQMCNELD